MKKWLWLTLLLVLALLILFVFQYFRQAPVYVDVESEKITLFPGDIEVVRSEISDKSGPLGDWLNKVADEDEPSYPLLFLRPGSNISFIRLTNQMRKRGIGFRLEPWETEKEIILPDESELSPYLDSNRDNWGPQNKIYFACRNNQLFFISEERLKMACNEKCNEISEQVDGDDKEFLRRALETTLEVDGYQVDFTYAMLGKYVLTPLPDTEGYSFDDPEQETDEMWFGAKLSNLDPEKQYLYFHVRPGGFEIFRKARALAQNKNIKVSLELLDEKAPIQIGPGGMRINPQ